jgi:microcin C transport system substrate-binding protein
MHLAEESAVRVKNLCVYSTLIFVAMAVSIISWSAPKPLGNASAPAGGTVNWNLGVEPTTLNPYSGQELVTTTVNTHIFDTLLSRDIDVNERVPALAERYEIAKDGKSMTFYLRKDAVFSDGKPVTAEDVKFSYDAIFDDAFKAAAKRPYFENFSGVEVVDPHTVKFLIKKKYFMNLTVAAEDLFIVPKHIYNDPKKNKMNKSSIGSGPMMLEKYEQGRVLILKKNDKWWGWKDPNFKNYYKIDRIQYRFVKEENAELEMLKRGEFDFLAMSPEQYFLKTTGAPFGTTVLKEKVQNLSPKSTAFIGWNFKNEIFKDRDVRMALTMLYDRSLLAKKFFFDMAVPATGPWYQQNDSANPNTKAIPFDPAKARELLQKAGWVDSDKDGVLDKIDNGQKKDFRFTLLNPNKDYEKYFTVYREQLKKFGIDMKIMNLEWNAFIKKVDEKDFDAIFLVWSGSLENDPKQIWHSASQAKGASNFISYSNPKVDDLIDKAREELDDKKRQKMLREVYDLIAQDVPYTFLVNMKYAFYAYNKRMGFERPTYKYSVGTNLWWINSK